MTRARPSEHQAFRINRHDVVRERRVMTSESIQKDIEAFMKNGGKIEVLPDLILQPSKNVFLEMTA